MSEWGSFRGNGTQDMAVLRSKALDAVRYFRDPSAREGMNTHIFGYPFSVVENGKLMDADNVRSMSNNIMRSLQYGGGVYEGLLHLTYNDSHNNKRQGVGGSGGVLIDDVTDIYIRGDMLHIKGREDYGKGAVREYRYHIQNDPGIIQPYNERTGQQTLEAFL